MRDELREALRGARPWRDAEGIASLKALKAERIQILGHDFSLAEVLLALEDELAQGWGLGTPFADGSTLRIRLGMADPPDSAEDRGPSAQACRRPSCALPASWTSSTSNAVLETVALVPQFPPASRYCVTVTAGRASHQNPASGENRNPVKETVEHLPTARMDLELAPKSSGQIRPCEAAVTPGP